MPPRRTSRSRARAPAPAQEDAETLTARLAALEELHAAQQAQLQEALNQAREAQMQAERIQDLENQLRNRRHGSPNPVPLPQEPIQVKPRVPDRYQIGDDIRYWILDVEINLQERRVPPHSQVNYAITYLGDAVRHRVNTMKMHQDPNTASWEMLKAWLTENYGIANPTLHAQLQLERLTMYPGQNVHEFITEFETYAAHTELNDVALGMQFRTKLPHDLMREIHVTYRGQWPETLRSWKEAAINAYNFIETTTELNLREKPDKKVRFATKSGPGPSRNPNVSTKTYREWRNAGKCTWCGKSGHWADACWSRTGKPGSTTDTDRTRTANNNPKRRVPSPPANRASRSSSTSTARSRSPSPKGSKKMKSKN